jgi:probable phosphoglycerate mutase
VIVEADGGSRGNPGPAGFGALVRDADTGELLAEVAAGIGTASNNVAEYQGLIAGLTAALDLGADAVEVRMDSKLVVEQMSGRWQVKHPDMKQLARQAAELVRRIPSVRFTHVRREFNRHADRLANEAMDAAAAGQPWRPSVAAAASAEAGSAAAGSAAQGQPRSANRLVGWSAPASPATSAILARHGETPLSIERRFNGVNDSALTERGVAQARAVAERLAAWPDPVTAVVCSPLRRTRQTAEIVAAALGLDLTEEPGIAETDFGAWDGLTFAEVRERWPDALEAWLADSAVAPPDGESIDAVGARVAKARDAICARWPATAVAVISHVTPIKTLVRDALGAPVGAVYRLHIDPASLSRIDWHADHHPVVRLVNDTSHLGDAATRHVA